MQPANGFERQIAYLEFVNDQLMSEINYIDRLLRSIGFPEGLQTIKNVASEVIEEEDCPD